MARMCIVTSSTSLYSNFEGFMFTQRFTVTSVSTSLGLSLPSCTNSFPSFREETFQSLEANRTTGSYSWYPCYLTISLVAMRSLPAYPICTYPFPCIFWRRECSLQWTQLLEFVTIDGKPVLHIVDEATWFSAAQFVPDVYKKTIWYINLLRGAIH